MKHGVHFISGLPRSGSTLLSTILRQNPSFHTGISTPLAAMVGTLQMVMSGRSEFHSFVDNERRRRVLRGVFESYYADKIADHSIFDTNRTWSSKMAVLAELFPEGKMIACVRSLVDILDSFERVREKNPLEPSRIYNYSAKGTVYVRTEKLMAPTGLIGAAFDGLKDAFFGAHSERLFVLPYEVLVADPPKAIAQLYEFLGYPIYDHDFENLNFEAVEFDRRLGAPGLHRVKPRVERTAQEPLLPPDLAARFRGSAFWEVPEVNVKKVRIAK